MVSVSKERAQLQERYTVLETKLKSANEALAQSEAQKKKLEQAMDELGEKWQEEIKLKEQVQQQVVNLLQQMKVNLKI